MSQIKIYGAVAPWEVLKGIVRDIRPIWVLEELGQAYERVALDPKKKENFTAAYLKINPFGKVPTLQDGDFSLFESAAICEYLAEKFKRLRPEPTTPEYYQWKQWNYFAVTNIEPQASRIWAADNMLEKNETTSKIRQMAAEGLKRFFPVLNDLLATREFILASGFSVSDVLLVTAINPIKEDPILADYPNLQRYLASMRGRPAFKKALMQNGI